MPAPARRETVLRSKKKKGVDKIEDNLILILVFVKPEKTTEKTFSKLPQKNADSRLTLSKKRESVAAGLLSAAQIILYSLPLLVVSDRRFYVQGSSALRVRSARGTGILRTAHAYVPAFLLGKNALRKNKTAFIQIKTHTGFINYICRRA